MLLLRHLLGEKRNLKITDLTSGVATAGTTVLSSGVATAVTAIDLSSVAVEDDLLLIAASAYNNSATYREVFFYDENTGTNFVHLIRSVETDGAQLQVSWFAFRVGATPSASLHYKWSPNAPAEGLDVYVAHVLEGGRISWS